MPKHTDRQTDRQTDRDSNYWLHFDFATRDILSASLYSYVTPTSGGGRGVGRGGAFAPGGTFQGAAF